MAIKKQKVCRIKFSEDSTSIVLSIVTETKIRREDTLQVPYVIAYFLYECMEKCIEFKDSIIIPNDFVVEYDKDGNILSPVDILTKILIDEIPQTFNIVLKKVNTGGFVNTISHIITNLKEKYKNNEYVEFFEVSGKLGYKLKKIMLDTSKVSTYTSWVLKSKQTYAKSGYNESIKCPMNKPFCYYSCEFCEKATHKCNFECPVPEHYNDCSKCRYVCKIQFTDKVHTMCGYGTIETIRG